jgi:hypothetical protein
MSQSRSSTSLFGRMIVSEKSATFRDHALMPLLFFPERAQIQARGADHDGH